MPSSALRPGLSPEDRARILHAVISFAISLSAAMPTRLWRGISQHRSSAEFTTGFLMDGQKLHGKLCFLRYYVKVRLISNKTLLPAPSVFIHTDV